MESSSERPTLQGLTIRKAGAAEVMTFVVHGGNVPLPARSLAAEERGPGDAPGNEGHHPRARRPVIRLRERARMKMTVEELDDNLTRISLHGRMDLEGTQAIDQKFAYTTSTQSLRLAVDLSSVSFLASIGLRTLLTAARAQAGRGGRMVLIAPNGVVKDTLEIAGVDRIVPIFKDWESARARLQAA